MQIEIEKFIKIDNGLSILVGWYIYNETCPLMSVGSPEDKIAYQVIEYQRQDIKKLALDGKVFHKKACGFIALIPTDTPKSRAIKSVVVVEKDRIVVKDVQPSIFSSPKDQLDFLAWISGENNEDLEALKSAGLGDIFNKAVFGIQNRLFKSELVKIKETKKNYKNLVLINTFGDDLQILELVIQAYEQLNNCLIVIGLLKKENRLNLQSALANLGMLTGSDISLCLGNAFNLDNLFFNKFNFEDVFFNSTDILAHQDLIKSVKNSSSKNIAVIAKELLVTMSRSKKTGDVTLDQGVLKVGFKDFLKIFNSIQYAVNNELTFQSMKGALTDLCLLDELLLDGSIYGFRKYKLMPYPNAIQSTENRYNYLMWKNA